MELKKQEHYFLSVLFVQYCLRMQIQYVLFSTAAWLLPNFNSQIKKQLVETIKFTEPDLFPALSNYSREMAVTLISLDWVGLTTTAIPWGWCAGIPNIYQGQRSDEFPGKLPLWNVWHILHDAKAKASVESKVFVSNWFLSTHHKKISLSHSRSLFGYYVSKHDIRIEFTPVSKKNNSLSISLAL